MKERRNLKMLEVNLPGHRYQIVIEKGALQTVGTWLKNIWKPQRVAIITDSNVLPLYEATVRENLKLAGFDVVTFTIEAGEASKSLANANAIWDFLADHQFTRSDGVVALGGGVVGDLAGFAASTYMRGIHFVQIPTTLLAQVDSSIGGKTAINTPKAKNMVGTFTQPDAVLIDPLTLNTLIPRRVREGIAEILKCAAIADLPLWNLLEQIKDEEDLLANHVEEVITHALDVKRKVVVEDELDNGIRLILNFGHTIGHAVENTAGYGVVSHGEGVAIGMRVINQHAEKLGLSPQGSTKALSDLITKYNLPIRHTPWPTQDMVHAITHDKKARGTTIKIILLEKIGKAKIVSIPMDEIVEYAKEGE
jgi:3-dehydroquinate synthase